MPQQPSPDHEPPPLEHSDSDDGHEYYDPAAGDEGGAGGDGDGAGDGGDGADGIPGNMPPKYDEANTTDPDDLFQKVGNIKLEWPDDDDIVFWISQLETKMRFAGIKSQFLKLQVLTNVLPAKLMPPIKPLLRLMTDETDATCYKRVKTRLLEVFGKKEEEEMQQASQIVMTSNQLPKKR